MNEEKKIDLKDRMLSDEDIEKVSGGLFDGNGNEVKCPNCGSTNVYPIWPHPPQKRCDSCGCTFV